MGRRIFCPERTKSGSTNWAGFNWVSATIRRKAADWRKRRRRSDGNGLTTFKFIAQASREPRRVAIAFYSIALFGKGRHLIANMCVVHLYGGDVRPDLLERCL